MNREAQATIPPFIGSLVQNAPCQLITATRGSKRPKSTLYYTVPDRLSSIPARGKRRQEKVEPGCTAYGYHYHEANEEVFYIISGTATVKTPQGEIEVPAGSAIAFPANANGAHVVMNKGAELLRYLDFGTRNAPDLVHFVGTGTGWACSATGKVYTFTEN